MLLQSLLADGQWAFLLNGYFGVQMLMHQELVAVFLLTEAGLSHRRASNFLVRDKKVTKEARLPTASGGTHCALAALRSNSRRKYEGLPQSGGATRAL